MGYQSKSGENDKGGFVRVKYLDILFVKILICVAGGSLDISVLSMWSIHFLTMKLIYFISLISDSYNYHIYPPPSFRPPECVDAT